MKFRPPAVPLITIDPYFSIWSFDDKLYGDHTRNWTGRRNAMTGLIKIDGQVFRFMGKVEPFSENYYTEPQIIEQINLDIQPMTTTYTFENNTVILTVGFMTPLILSNLELMSRPVSYLFYDVKTKDGKEHDISIYFDISAECCVDNKKQNVKLGKSKNSIFCGNEIQKPLNKSGDDVRIDWGYLHLSHENSFFTDCNGRKAFAKCKEINQLDLNKVYNLDDDYPVLATVTNEKSGYICIAYDDVKSIEYFNEHLDCYYKKNGATFETALADAVNNFKEALKMADTFNKDLIDKASKISNKYADIVSLAYRQAIAAHKLVWDGENALFMSKECFSNGCIATVDVTYPSIPLFLLYNTELVKGMLRPIFKYSRTKDWKYDFAPHDVGQYPIANGQVYGDNKLEFQMPVEECANMLVCVGAVCKADGNNSFAEENKDLLEKWAKYLIENGYDPENQLCTDDFAGHLAHNCNLSVKAIIGIAAYGIIFNDKKYIDEAKRLAKAWKHDANDNDHYKLTFDKKDTWSLKYNMVWDRIFGTNIFDKDIFEDEVKYYTTKLNKYGVPLDNRSDYTKIDWLMWSTVMSDNQEYANKVIDSIWDMLCETRDRVPLTDWYFTSSAEQVGFQNRTVVGGLFINLFKRD